MKPLSILFAIVTALILAGCADPLEKTTGQDVGSRLERGVTGQGQIGPQERDPGDPAAEHGVPQTHP
jgi:hypothetical protein